MSAPKPFHEKTMPDKIRHLAGELDDVIECADAGEIVHVDDLREAINSDTLREIADEVEAKPVAGFVLVRGRVYQNGFVGFRSPDYEGNMENVILVDSDDIIREDDTHKIDKSR